MKIRNGFVSNSSSSSFIILLHKLSDEQKNVIYNHKLIAQKIDDKLKSEGKDLIYEYYDEWSVSEDGFSLWCFTTMDNFNLIDFVQRELKINYKDIIYMGDGDYGYELHEDDIYYEMKRKYKLNKIKKIINERN